MSRSLVSNLTDMLMPNEYIGEVTLDGMKFDFMYSDNGRFVLTGEIFQKPTEVYIQRARDAGGRPRWTTIEIYQKDGDNRYFVSAKDKFTAWMPLPTGICQILDAAMRRHYPHIEENVF